MSRILPVIAQRLACPALLSACLILPGLVLGAPVLTERQQLIDSDARIFGSAVAMDANRVVIGAPGETDYAGAVYVYRYAAGSWSLQAKLLASDASGDARFGDAVAIDGDVIAVGAPGADGGAVYVYERASGAWLEQAKLTASDALLGDLVGHAVALEGDTLIAGAPRHGARRGAAYVYTRDASGTWAERDKLSALDAAPSDEFGFSAAIDGESLVVGAWQDDATGSAYVFNRDGSGNWVERTKLTASLGTGATFGRAVALRGDTALVAAPFAVAGGAVFVYAFDPATGEWPQQQRLEASDGGPSRDLHVFGFALATDGDRALIGDIGDNESGLFAGAVYVFARSTGGSWTGKAKLLASDAQDFDYLGGALALAGDMALVSSARVGTGASYAFELGTSASGGSLSLPSADVPVGSASDNDTAGLTFFGNPADDARRVIVEDARSGARLASLRF